MNILDCIVLALSILVVFAVGVLSGRRSRASASEGEFLMANKSLNKLQTGFSTAATDFGGSGMVGAIGYCYLVGMSGIWWNLTAAPAFLIVGFLFAKAFNRMDSATLPDYLGKRYSPAVKLLASVMHICSNVALLSSQFTIACAVLYTITGFSMTLCLIICLLLVICLTSGGLRSVVNTDAVLFVIIVTSLVVAVPIVLHAGGGLGSIAARLPDGFLRVTELGFWTPFSWFLLCFIGYSTNQNYVQRMAAAETEDTARFGAIFSGCFYLIISVILGIIGISAAVLMPGIEDSNAVFPELLLRFFPHGLIGLGVAGVFAATISTATSILHATTTLIVNDIWVPLRREKAVGVVRVSRAMVWVVALLSIGISMVSQNIINVIYISGLFYGACVFVPMVFGMKSSFANANGALASMLAALAVSLAWEYLPRFRPAVLEALPSNVVGILIGAIVLTAVSKLGASGSPRKTNHTQIKE